MANRPIAHGVVLLTPAGVEYTAGGDAGTAAVQGNVASGAADSGNPVKAGGVYNSTLPAFTTGQRADFQTDPNGRLVIVINGSTGTSSQLITGSVTNTDAISVGASNQAMRVLSHGTVFNGTTFDRMRGNTVGTIVIPPAPWTYAVGTGGILVSTTTAVTFKASAGAGLRNYITSMQIGHPTLGGTTELVIRDGAAGTVIWRDFLQVTAGESRAIPLPGPLAGTAATLLEIVTLTSVTGGIYFNAQGFAAP